MMDMVNAVSAVSVRVAKVRACCTVIREVVDGLALSEDVRTRETIVTTEDLLAVLDDEIRLLSEDVRNAEVLALRDGKEA